MEKHAGETCRPQKVGHGPRRELRPLDQGRYSVIFSIVRLVASGRATTLRVIDLVGILKPNLSIVGVRK